MHITFLTTKTAAYARKHVQRNHTIGGQKLPPEAPDLFGGTKAKYLLVGAFTWPKPEEQKEKEKEELREIMADFGGSSRDRGWRRLCK